MGILRFAGDSTAPTMEAQILCSWPRECAFQPLFLEGVERESKANQPPLFFGGGREGI